MNQQPLGLETKKIDITRFVQWEPATTRQQWRVGAGGGRRSGEVGACLGTLGLRHAGGYEVLLEFPDGKIESFSPLALFPHLVGK